MLKGNGEINKCYLGIGISWAFSSWGDLFCLLVVWFVCLLGGFFGDFNAGRSVPDNQRAAFVNISSAKRKHLKMFSSPAELDTSR